VSRKRERVETRQELRLLAEGRNPQPRRRKPRGPLQGPRHIKGDVFMVPQFVEARNDALTDNGTLVRVGDVLQYDRPVNVALYDKLVAAGFDDRTATDLAAADHKSELHDARLAGVLFAID